MAKKYYVVWAGRKTGIFTDWPTTQASVNQFPGARYKSFPTLEQAEAAFKGGSGSKVAPKKRTTTSKKPTVSTNKPAAEIQIYCDGASDPNPGQAGSGIAIYRQQQLSELWYGRYNPRGTNNTAELNALHQSLVLAGQLMAEGKSVEILCDSMYSINCIKTWAKGWQQKGWVRPGGEIKNLDIIQPAFALYQKLAPELQLSHVKAHAGTEGNELADRMSMVAVDKQDPDWQPYPAPFDIPALLRMRAG